MLVRCCIFTRAKKKDKARYAKAASAEDDNTTMVGESTASLTTAGANGKPMTGAWIGTPRSQRLPPPGGFTPSPGGGFGQSPRRRTNASPAGANNGGTPLTDTPVRRTKSRAGQKGKYSIITSLDDDPEESEEARPAIGRTNSLYASSEYMRELRKKGAGPLPTSYNVVPNPDTERLPPTYFAVAEQPAAAGPSGSRSSPPRPAVVAVANEDRGDADGSTVLPGTRDFNRAYAQAKFPKRPIEGFPLSTSSLALVGEEEHPLQSQTSSANVSNATLVGPTQQETESGNGEQHNAQTRAESWVTFRAPDLERSRSSSPQYPPGLEADIAYEGINGSLEDEDFYEEEGRGLLDPLKEAEDDMDTSLPYRSNKARSRCTDNSSAMDQEAHETTPKRNSPQQPGTPGRRRPLPPTPGQPSLLSPNPFTAWSHPPKKEHEDEDEVQWGTTIRLLSAQGSMRSASSAESGEVVQTGQAI
ncbi:hypothetical protein FRB90_001066 [Tulasnella sp. 427]|nr:hypothetical protein FRB90_001066 [Tulasnella sp. 427]